MKRGDHRRKLETMEMEAWTKAYDKASEKGTKLPDPPTHSALGHWFRRATNDRRLVLFTLGILVTLIVIFVFVIEMWGNNNDVSSTVTTSLVTLAGTALGFIGGMVASDRSKNENVEPGASGAVLTK